MHRPPLYIWNAGSIRFSARHSMPCFAIRSRAWSRPRSTGSLSDGKALNTNPDRPIPEANTGSAFLNWLANASTTLVHLERRFDPLFRPAFDAVLRDPIARLVTASINRKRPNEGLKIAEEKPLPDEEAYLDSIIASFEKQMRLLGKPGGFERGGNTKTHGIVRDPLFRPAFDAVLRDPIAK